MLDITSLDEIRGNNVAIYAIKKLLDEGNYPRFSILSGYMGVGKSTVARLISEQINKSEFGVTTINLGLDVDMKKVEEQVFKMNPVTTRAFVLEEMHGLDKSQQTALLTMLDHQPSNVYVICTTTELYKILRTIRSRATVWEFKLLAEKQLVSLLDDYLESKEVKLSDESKKALVRSAYGVPRDLLKNTDLAISGGFTSEQLNELMGQVSDDFMFTLFMSLKSNTLDFATNIAPMLNDGSNGKLQQFRDFYTRFLIERQITHNRTLNKAKVDMLSDLYTEEELKKIGNTLVKATQDTLMLELTILNMELCSTTRKAMRGQQIDRVASNEMNSTAQYGTDEVKNRINKAKVSLDSIKEVHF